MQNRLLEDLDQKIRTTSSRVDWSRLMCRKSVLLARQGQLDAAQRQIDQVRKVWGEELHHEVASWVMMAEGVLHFFRLDTHMAWERLRRAHALAVALRTESSRASCAAWMALLAFNGSRYDEMCERLREVLTEAAAEDHHARGRACLIIADAYHVAGRWDLARPWYDRARHHAACEGDQAMISATLYNTAAFRTANVRLTDAFGELDDFERERAETEAGSSMTYDAAVGAMSIEDYTPLMRGQLLGVVRKFEDALKMFSAIDPQRIRKEEQALLLAERAWCHSRLNQSEIAVELAEAALEQSTVFTEADDLAYVTARLADAYMACNDDHTAASLRTRAEAHYEAHRQFQLELIAKLDSMGLTAW